MHLWIGSAHVCERWRYRRGCCGRGNVNHLVMVAAISSRRAFLRRASRSWPGGRLIALFLDWLGIHGETFFKGGRVLQPKARHAGPSLLGKANY